MKLLMKKRMFILLSVLLLLFTGCASNQVKKNDPENLKQIPYTFEGSKGDWTATIELRALAESDKPMLQKKLQKDSTKGYRTVFHLNYTGDKDFKSLEYTFAASTQWESGGKLKAKDKNTGIKEVLDGKAELGGIFYSEDTKVGGPVPPKNEAFTFKIKAKTTDGKTVKTKFKVKAT